MFNVGGSIIGLHDANAHKIQFNAVFIGRQNAAFAKTHDGSSPEYWNVTVEKHTSGGQTGVISNAASIDNNGLLTYSPTVLEDTSITDRPYYTMIKVNCRAYSPDNDAYEELTFWFRYGQIAT